MVEEQDIQALSDHVILEILEDGEARTPSGLLIPATAANDEQHYHRYRVISVGPDCSDDHLSEIREPSIFPGDIVIVSPQNTGVFMARGRRYHVAHYESIAAVIDEPIRVEGDIDDTHHDNSSDYLAEDYDTPDE